MNAPSQTRSAWMSFAMPAQPSLASSTRADVCIIGAGIAGMTTAYLLAKKGYSVVVIDDGPVGGGMSGRTTAHLTNAIDDRYVEIERLHGAEGARLAAQSHSAAIEAIEAIARHEAIDCDFERLDGYLFLAPGEDPGTLLQEYAAASRAGVEGLAWADRAPMPGIDTGPCLRFPRQGQFHPLKYLAGLARAIHRLPGRIHSGTHASRIDGGDAPCMHTSDGFRIDCGAVVVATNVPISDRLAIHAKQAPYLTYVIAARVPRGSIEKALYWDTLDPYHYVRLKGAELLIVGGEDHKTGQADDPERRFANLELWMRERFPGALEVAHRWSGQVMETIDYLALIGRDAGERNVYVATGDSGMGMTHGTIAGLIITDLIHGAEVPWARLYDPARVTMKAAGNYVREAAHMAWQYADWIKPGDVGAIASIPPSAGAVIRRGVHKIAVYRDARGDTHELSARCTHLGCVVHWNAAENTWDCKCHGSRFDAFGEVLSGPAVSPLQAPGISSPAQVNPSRRPPGTPPPPPP